MGRYQVWCEQKVVGLQGMQCVMFLPRSLAFWARCDRHVFTHERDRMYVAPTALVAIDHGGRLEDKTIVAGPSGPPAAARPPDPEPRHS